MRRIQYSLSGGLTQDDLRQIHAEVQDVLGEIGMGCAHKRTLDALAGHDGITVKGERIFFAPTLVDEYIERFRNSGGPGIVPTDEVRMISGAWNCFNIEDMDTGKVRPSTAADVREMFKLLEVNDCWPMSPVWPRDMHPELGLLYMEKAGIELTDCTGSLMEYSDEKLLEYNLAMFQAAGRKFVLHIQFPISPLHFNASALDKIWRYMHRDDVELKPFPGPIPQAGLTVPLPAPAAIVQEIAETFAGCIVVDKISEGKFAPGPDFRMDLFDMRHMTITEQSPDYVLWQLLVRDVYEYFTAVPKTWHTIHTHAKLCDQQSMMERTALVTTLAFGGFRNFFFGAGQMSMDEVFSPAQFVLDFEIARYVTHILRGLAYDETPGAALKIIREVGEGGQYIMHDSTLDGFRDLYESELMPRTSVDQWRAAGEPSLLGKARQKARDMIASYDRPPLPDDVQSELDRIYAEAEAYLADR
jgi:trimethylamine:corrinoid methyltransferase-like protein